MSYTVILHAATEKDYAEAYEWYEDKMSGLGERFIKAVRNKIEEISQHPETFGFKSNKKYREAAVDYFPYLIVYKVYPRERKIFISSIHHAKKNPNKKFRK